MIKLKFKCLHPFATPPSYAKSGDAGLDLTCIGVSTESGVATYYTGLALEIPEGHVGLIFPRSSIFKYGAIQANAVGVIDSGYRGEILIKHYHDNKLYQAGERVAQLMILPFPTVELEQVDELSETERGANGYGSSGK